ncbi:DUF2252 family protein [Pseudonocardia sp.]|uniref:DUF2252 domain-containing protein n=1 Tax=Pseudonocardia sp. TaxID=60912 RepID=UPI00260E72AA|nr:DUF2252 family protein [Pseudonocardia sp.]
MIPDDETLARATRRDLYDLAKRSGIPGRSTLGRDGLAEALRAHRADGDAPTAQRMAAPTSRMESFRELAQQRAAGGMVLLPRLLTDNDRRLHVRQTVREDHSTRIMQGSEETAAKFEKLAASRYSFHRGTCLLFYRDLAGEDALMPTVLALGDVHPENFGVMPSSDNVPIFGVNDFDEAYYAPFTWDIKRGATGFLVAADEAAGLGRKRRRRIARCFVEGYVEGIRTFARDGSEGDHQIRRDNAPKLIRKIFDAAEEERHKWLASDYHDEYGQGFRSSRKLVPVTSRREEFQDLVDRLVREQGIEVPERAGRMRVKDVAIRKGQGTASLGLDRYYVLIEGRRADATDDLILEFKQARRSALAGLVPPSDFAVDGAGERIAHAQSVQLVNGDVFYGGIEFDGRSFMSRERAPYRESIDVEDIGKKDWPGYARICGRSLAHAHSLSDESGRIDHDVEPDILAAMGPVELFVDDMLRYAEEADDRLRRDHEYFVADFELGAFRDVDRAFR